MKHLTIILSILLLLLFVQQCNTDTQKEIEYMTEKVELKRKVVALLKDLEASEHRADSLKAKKDSVRIEYKDRIKYIRSLTQPQHDSLFAQNFPSKDSANLTAEYLKECRIQLSLSDSIIATQDTQIVDLRAVIALKDKEIALELNRADNAEKQGRAKSTRSFLWGLGIGTTTGYILGKIY